MSSDVLEAVTDAAAPGRAERYQERLSSGAEALDRGRYEEARRMVASVVRDLPDVAFGHEIVGLASYRLGQWQRAAVALEQARQLDGSVRHLAVLADCYRALRRYDDALAAWDELRAASPDHALMAEGRIVAAGALADRGDVRGALRLMLKSSTAPKKVRDHHLRQWYVIGDLYDRLGDVINARRFFQLVRSIDPNFVDVSQRISALGR